ncbi:Uncharacterised protein [Mycobacteroides abscessus subsp. massiliense]|nr:Uncharacterised protein [Mycobacteroides abscessus subsp. massiliense]
MLAHRRVLLVGEVVVGDFRHGLGDGQGSALHVTEQFGFLPHRQYGDPLC